MIFDKISAGKLLTTTKARPAYNEKLPVVDWLEPGEHFLVIGNKAFNHKGKRVMLLKILSNGKIYDIEVNEGDEDLIIQ